MPGSRADGLVARHQPTRQGQQEHDGVVSHFLGAVVGHVADDDAVPAGRVQVDVVVSHAGPDHALAPARSREARFSQVGDVVKEHDRVGLGQVIGQFLFLRRLAQHQRGDLLEHGRLDRGLVQKISDHHRETTGTRHRRLLGTSTPDRGWWARSGCLDRLGDRAMRITHLVRGTTRCRFKSPVPGAAHARIDYRIR